LNRLIEKIRRIAGDRLSGEAHPGQTPFAAAARGKLILLAAGLAAMWHLATPATLTNEERALWEKVRSAQLHMASWRLQEGTASGLDSDPWDCGLIGVEWSGITTTLGDLSSKRTACNPAWAVQFSRWFRQLGLEKGDRVAIYSSASFPGLLLNAIAATEALQLEPLLIVSLGASTWGANHLRSPWPALSAELRRGGFMLTKADYYTLGGGDELGHGLSPEGLGLLKNAAEVAGVELLSANSLQEMIALKAGLLRDHGAQLFVNIGGSHANLGDAETVLKLTPGLLAGNDLDNAGNGVIGAAVDMNIRVIHMLNIKSVSQSVGIPYDSTPRESGPVRVHAGWSATGILLFFIVLFRHKRWSLATSGAAGRVPIKKEISTE
jgi:poly-gamma-glutamate system protein